MKRCLYKLAALTLAAALALAGWPAAAKAENQTGIVTGSAVNVRSAPGGSIIACLRRDSRVDILGTEGGYYKVRLSDGTQGYMWGQYIAVQSGGTAAAASFNTNQTLRVGSRGADVSSVQRRLKELGFFTYPSITEYYGTITEAAVKAFQAGQGLSQTGVADPATLVKLMGEQDDTGGSAAAPAGVTYQLGSRGPVVSQIQSRLKALGFFTYHTITEYYGTITRAAVRDYQASLSLSQTGVVDEALLALLLGTAATASPAATPAPSPAPTAGPVQGVMVTVPPQYGSLRNDICLRKGSKGADVRDLQNALKQRGFYTGAVDGIFGIGTQSAVMAFQRFLSLDADGLAGNYTLSALYSLLAPLSEVGDQGLDTAPAAKAEILTWATASNLIPRGTSFIVVDVLTGISFRGYRSGGTHHADVEPLTATDTNILNGIYGGKWSWNRRPIWVVYNGRRLAASMNGMPHGTGTIKGNDMVGQFCIHFSGSLTHGTLRTDPLHQAAIQAAYDAGQ